MTKQNFYIFSLFAFAVLTVIGLYYLSQKSTCCGDCHAHSHAIERTFAIIKPDAVAAGHTQAILDLIEKNGFKIIAQKEITLDANMAEQFYGVHKEKPFYNELVDFITSGPVVVLALEKENAIHDWRELMGSTNPESAAKETIRKLFGTSISKNAVHGSDSSETAAQELKQFFPEL